MRTFKPAYEGDLVLAERNLNLVEFGIVREVIGFEVSRIGFRRGLENRRNLKTLHVVNQSDLHNVPPERILFAAARASTFLPSGVFSTVNQAGVWLARFVLEADNLPHGETVEAPMSRRDRLKLVTNRITALEEE